MKNFIPKTRLIRGGGSTTIRIKGKTVDRNAALILYRCAECLGKLRKEGFGLVCDSGCEGKNFIHRQVASQIKEARAKQVEEVQQYYKSVNGRLVPKGEKGDA